MRLVGDDAQLTAIGAGGVLRDLRAAHGAIRLTDLHRFADPTEAAATLALRDGHAEAPSASTRPPPHPRRRPHPATSDAGRASYWSEGTSWRSQPCKSELCTRCQKRWTGLPEPDSGQRTHPVGPPRQRVTQGRRRLVPAQAISDYVQWLLDGCPQASMVTRRSNGKGGLRWDEDRQRWIGRASLGYSADGKRRIGTVSSRTKTEARAKLRALLRDHDNGLPSGRNAYTVREAVESWLNHGLIGRDPHTLTNRTSLARTHVIASLGQRRLST